MEKEMFMKILVSGGTGYIGSHTCVELLEAGHSVVIADNLCNSQKNVVDKIETISGIRPDFFEIDVTDEIKTQELFEKYSFDGVIHFAGLKAVGESVNKPLEYYYNNLVSTMVLSKLCLKYKVPRFVFSSSATVYGENKPPFSEDMELRETTNPYGETKAMSERILMDTAKVNPELGVSLLRYFNPVGAHRSGLIGELPNGIPNNLMPFITQVAKGKREKVSVFGNDYDTVDGTGVRDYIHVVDLAKGHVIALEKLGKGVDIFNLGTGRGTSVLELIHAFETVNEVKVPYEIAPRRAGDLAEFYADVKKAEIELGWKTELTIEDMVRDSWNFEKNYQE